MYMFTYQAPSRFTAKSELWIRYSNRMPQVCFQQEPNSLKNVLRDLASIEAFRKTVHMILGTENPTRSQLNELGRIAAKVVSRHTPWTGAYIYCQLHAEKYPKYQMSAGLLDAVKQIAGQMPMGLRRVEVLAVDVVAGAIVRAKSRPCAQVGCVNQFVPAHTGQKYCSDRCKRRAAADHKKRARLCRREQQ